MLIILEDSVTLEVVLRSPNLRAERLGLRIRIDAPGKHVPIRKCNYKTRGKLETSFK
jgi:hypothetical protein